MYDERDPRTWDNAQLQTWLTAQFEELAVRDIEKGVLVLPQNQATRLATTTIDSSKMFPPPTTGKQATRLYCIEFVSLCLASTTLPTPLSPKNEKVVQDHALDVYSSFGYLWATARTRTRKEVMKTRKQGDEEDYWGKQAFKSVPSRFIPRQTGD